MVTDPVIWVLFAALWASFLWFRYLRTARTVAYLLTATAVYLAAGWAPEPWPLILRLFVLLTMVAMHFWFGEVLSALPPAISEFRDSYVAINRRMTAAYANYEKTKTRGALEMALGQAVADLRSLQLPSGEEWHSLRSAAIALVGKRLTMLRDGTDTDSGAALHFKTERAEVQKRFWDALERSKRFWR